MWCLVHDSSIRIKLNTQRIPSDYKASPLLSEGSLDPLVTAAGNYCGRVRGTPHHIKNNLNGIDRGTSSIQLSIFEFGF
jgi:hypothetical protein